MAVTVAYLDKEPNGLAAMLGGVIEGNLAAHAEREALLAERATYAVVAQDVDVAVSIRLGDGAVKVRNGVVGRPDILVQADSDTLISLSTVPLRFGLPDATKPEGRAARAAGQGVGQTPGEAGQAEQAAGGVATVERRHRGPRHPI